MSDEFTEPMSADEEIDAALNAVFDEPEEESDSAEVVDAATEPEPEPEPQEYVTSDGQRFSSADEAFQHENSVARKSQSTFDAKFEEQKRLLEELTAKVGQPAPAQAAPKGDTRKMEIQRRITETAQKAAKHIEEHGYIPMDIQQEMMTQAGLLGAVNSEEKFAPIVQEFQEEIAVMRRERAESKLTSLVGVLASGDGLEEGATSTMVEKVAAYVNHQLEQGYTVEQTINAQNVKALYDSIILDELRQAQSSGGTQAEQSASQEQAKPRGGAAAAVSSQVQGQVQGRIKPAGGASRGNGLEVPRDERGRFTPRSAPSPGTLAWLEHRAKTRQAG